MPKPRETKKIRGVFEKVKGSDVWWIEYYTQGRRYRERAGTRGNAIKLYQRRKSQIVVGDKLPELRRRRITFGELIDDAIAYARENNASLRDYEGKGKLLRPAFGDKAAEDIKPEEFAAWLRKRGVSSATFNRYRAFMSLCYREGMRSGKVKANPLKLLAQKREPRGRKRYLSRKEYDTVLAKMQELHPKYAAAFIISIHTGMRLTEQFSLRWRQIDMVRREIHLIKTKNGDDRSVPMMSIVFDQFVQLREGKPAPGDMVFARKFGGEGAVQLRWFRDLLKLEGVAIEDYTWHNNRHTFCSWLAIAGTPLRTIQELAGHKTITMTARYSHLSPDHKISELEKLNPANASEEKKAEPKLVEFPTATSTATGVSLVKKQAKKKA